VASPPALPEPEDLNAVLAPAAGGAPPPVEVRALALTDFRRQPGEREDQDLYYGGSARVHAAFWRPGPAGEDAPATRDYRFASRQGAARPTVGQMLVVATASGLILSAALDRQGSMNRFAGGWSG
jgi:hypothetical protein